MPIGDDNFVLISLTEKSKVFPGAYTQVLGRETFSVHLNKDNKDWFQGLLKR